VDDRLDPTEDLGAGESAVLDSADGTRSTFSTWCPCSSRSRTTARPAFPLPPVTAILAMTTLLSVPKRTSFSVEHTMTELADLPILASSLSKPVSLGGASCGFEPV
jgi:hypothetical protein